MRVVFVCTGNTCRSPLAAALLRQQEPEVEVLSAGVMAVPGTLAAAEAQVLAAELGSDLSTHRAQPLSAEHVHASLVLTLTRAHRDMVLQKFPEASHRVFSLGEYAGESERDVADPVGRGMPAYRQAAREISDLLARARTRFGWLFLGAVGTASDTGGGRMRPKIIAHLTQASLPTVDLGVGEGWQAIGRAAAISVQRGDVRAALAISTDPSGVALVANRFTGVRAVTAADKADARRARHAYDANLLCLHAPNPAQDSVWEIAGAFLHTEAGDPGVGARIEEYARELSQRPRP